MPPYSWGPNTTARGILRLYPHFGRKVRIAGAWILVRRAGERWGQGIGHAGEVYGVVVGPAFFLAEGACGELPSAAIAIVGEVLGGSSLVAGWLFITSKCLVGGVGGEILEPHGGGAITRSDAEIGADLAAL
jgi:hypothetical protein